MCKFIAAFFQFIAAFFQFIREPAQGEATGGAHTAPPAHAAAEPPPAEAEKRVLLETRST
jgi:hypothetical protein